MILENWQDVISLVLKVAVASFSAVGIEEYLKNFIKTDRTIVYSIIMPFLSIGSFIAISKLPIEFIGSLLTIGTVQLDYQLLVQGFKKIFDRVTDKKIEE